jgi:tetratricopeptide (TPR) repeat protein
MTNEQGRSGISGKLTVAIIVTVAVVLALVAVSFWRWRLKLPAAGTQTPTQTSVPDGAGSKTWDPQAAALAIMSVRKELEVAEAEQRVDEELVNRAKRVVEKFPHAPEASRLVADVLMARQDWAEAFNWLTRSLEADNQRPDVHLLAGTVAMKIDRYEDAARHFGVAAELVPDDIQPRLYLASLYQHMGDDDKALRALLEARQIDTHSPQVYAMMADIYASQRKWSLAITNLKHAIDNTAPTDKATINAYNLRLARFLNKWNKPEDALLVLDSLPGKGLRDAMAVEQRATAQAMLRRNADAAVSFEAAATLQGFNGRLMVEAVRQYILAGNKAGAEIALDRIREDAPDQPEIEGLQMQIDEMGTPDAGM